MSRWMKVALVLLAVSIPLPALVQSPPPVAAEEKKTDNRKSEAPTVTLPATKTAKPNRYFCLRAAGNCTSIKWIIPSGLDKLDPEIQIKDPNVAVLIGDTGTYVVQAYGALGDLASDIASCTVTISNSPGPTPPPGPGPGPAPDALAQALQKSYAQDKDADRATSLQFLQGVYAGMAELAPTWTSVKTVADAFAMMKGVVEAPSVGLPADKVANLRKAIAAELIQALGTSSTAPITLPTLTTEIQKIATALKGIS